VTRPTNDRNGVSDEKLERHAEHVEEDLVEAIGEIERRVDRAKEKTEAVTKRAPKIAAAAAFGAGAIAAFVGWAIQRSTSPSARRARVLRRYVRRFSFVRPSLGSRALRFMLGAALAGTAVWAIRSGGARLAASRRP